MTHINDLYKELCDSIDECTPNHMHKKDNIYVYIMELQFQKLSTNNNFYYQILNAKEVEKLAKIAVCCFRQLAI